MSSGTALQQDYVICKVESKHLMMNILAAVHFSWYFSFAVIIWNQSYDYKSHCITACQRHFSDEGFLELFVKWFSLNEIINRVRLTIQSGEIMDGANAIIVCIMFVPGSGKYEGLLWGYQAKIINCDLLHCFIFHDKKSRKTMFFPFIVGEVIFVCIMFASLIQ